MSDSSVKKIEKAVDRLVRRQDEICARLERLEERLESAGGPTRSEVIRFLDRFAAAETFGEELLGAWIAACGTECLKGGLRTIQMREGSHARLLRERVKELGGTCDHELPEKTREVAMQTIGGTDMTDPQKLQSFLAQFPDVDAALRELNEFAARLGNDPETQSLLQTIEQDERSTLVWLTRACQQLG